VGASYNVLLVSNSHAYSVTQTATVANTPVGKSWTEINYANCDSSLYGYAPLVTASWNGGVYDNHALGLWNDAKTGHWNIFHEDGTAIPLGATYFVMCAVYA
jgi:hypothetical protein